MALPEDVEKFPEGNTKRIKINLDSLGMVSESAVGWVLCCTACIADARPYYSGDTPEPGVRAPESAEAECGGLDLLRSVLVYWGNAGQQAG